MPKPITVLLAAAVLLSAATAGAGSTALKDVMKQIGGAAGSGDTAAMAPLLERTKGMQPNDPAFAGWKELAEQGRAAAAGGDLAGAKATCKTCHDKYRDSYRTKYGSKAP